MNATLTDKQIAHRVRAVLWSGAANAAKWDDRDTAATLRAMATLGDTTLVHLCRAIHKTTA